MRIVIYGVSTRYASELLETIARLGWDLAAAVRNLPGTPVPEEFEAFVDVDELGDGLKELPFAVPQVTPEARREAVADALSRGFRQLATLVDPSAVVARSARLGEGVYVAAGAVLGAGVVLGEGCLVNRSCSVGHHVRFGDYVSSGPAAVLAGSCIAEDEAFIGAGAVLAPKLRVGRGAIVGAGAVVLRDVTARTVVVGNPARELRAV